METKPKGTYDVLPSEVILWQNIESKIREVCKLCNYEEIRTPIFENAKVFHRDEKDSSDMVNKETYDFLDRGQRLMTLRPEGTAGVVRAYIENKLYVTKDVCKLYYLGPMFRYERPQKGRYRQFSQFGIEAIGSDSYMVDVDVINVAILLFKKLGLKGLRVRINTLGDKESRLNYREALVNYFSDKIDNLCSDCKNRLENNPLRILDCKVDKDNPILLNAPKIKDYLNEVSVNHFNNVLALLKELNIDYIVDERLVRGLDYYSHTVFEIEYNSSEMGNQNIICGGGRYSDLVSDLGGPVKPACGLAFGLDRLIQVLKMENNTLEVSNSLDCFVISLGKKAMFNSQKIINDLRLAGISCDGDFNNKSLKAQFKIADSYNSHFTLILGEDELEKNVIRVKNNVDDSQEEVNLGDLVNYLKEKSNEKSTN